MFGGDGLRVELDAVDGEFLVADTHDFALVGCGGDFEAVRGASFVEEEGVVAGSLEVLWEPVEQAFPVVGNRGELSVHDPACPDDVPAKVLGDALVPKANAHDGELPLEGL